jgi:hypothetical protein
MDATQGEEDEGDDDGSETEALDFYMGATITTKKKGSRDIRWSTHEQVVARRGDQDEERFK